MTDKKDPVIGVIPDNSGTVPKGGLLGLLGGVKAGEFIVIGMRPSTGKSLLAEHLAQELCERKDKP